MPDATPWTVACAADTRGPHLDEAVHLFRTMRRFGGRLACTDAVFYVVGTVDADRIEPLLDLQVNIHVTEPTDPGNPYANKLRILQHHLPETSLLALDTDILFHGDPVDYLSNNAFCAKPVDQDPFTIEQWHRIFGGFGVVLPSARYLTSFHARETIPYFNSGVLAIPGVTVPTLHQSWKDCLHGLPPIFEANPDINEHRFFADQVALAVAIVQSRILFRALPLALNFPTHSPIHLIERPAEVSPVLLHHHHRYNCDNQYKASGYAKADIAIAEINNFLLEPLQPESSNSANDAEFDNRSFWQRRYDRDPELGSGVGSRGENASFKRQVISSVIECMRPTNILDVGCGDMEVIGPIINHSGYKGLDISEVVTAKNRSLFPHLHFECRDFCSSQGREPEQFDLVMCFDVLIHQHRRVEYERFVEALVCSTRGIGLVSGYLSFPRSAYRSAITAYHEPLSRTLRRHGATSISVIASYRDTSVLRFSMQ